jgi:hypothetical protein
MERELGISYPTVRGRVDALVRALGLADDADSDATVEADAAEPMEDLYAAAAEADVESDAVQERRAILERLSRREIGAEEAAAALRGLSGS